MKWGQDARSLWPLEGGLIFLNHGSYGAVAAPVQAEMMAWRQKLDARPDYFFRELYPAALENARQALADFLHTPIDGLALVENATAGVQAVINSLYQSGHFSDHKTILYTNHIYGAVRTIIHQSGIPQRMLHLPVTPTAPEQLIDVIETGLQDRPSLLVIDHITSPTALILPIDQIIARAHHYDVPVLVDGAHAPGMIPLDLAVLGADFYVGNCHKWLGAGRGTGFIAVAKPWHRIMRPLVASHWYDRGYPDHFGWVGTRDPSAWLSLPAAIAFRQQWPLADTIRHGHSLLDHAAQSLPILTPDWARGLMACYDLGQGNTARADWLWCMARDAQGIEAAFISFEDRLLLRLSAFIYNQNSDIDALMTILPDLLQKVPS